MLHDKGLHRQSLERRLFNGGHVADTGEGHVQRTRYGCGREREHVYLTAHLLYMFLVRDAEALFLVHHQQAQVLEFDVFLQQPVGTYYEVALAGGQVGERLFYLRTGTKTA